jgi:fused signal recognition particle receptor
MFHDSPQIWYFLAGGSLALAVVWALIFMRRRRRRSTPPGAPLTLALEKTHRHFMARWSERIAGAGAIDESTLAELEEILLGADVGVSTTQKLLRGLREEMAQRGARDIGHLKEYLGDQILKILGSFPEGSRNSARPRVLMVVGVNGVGKTTSIAKLAHRYHKHGEKILLAAADTFRAGAVHQLQVWGERVGVATLAPQAGADPAAVAFDAVKAGQARGLDTVIIDTAGRLHTKVNLMEELKKVKRVLDKAMTGAPHELWLVVDATQGQNALQQARQFHEALGLTGLILSKLDSSSKGGILVAIAEEIKVPIVFVGVGEKLQDLQAFDAREYVQALLA